jgi:dihydroflavonol-4-reductase
MNVGVTGATGFLGGHVATALLAAGHRTVGVVRSPERGTIANVTWRRADLGDREALRSAFDGLDVVVANAALSPGWAAADDATFLQANVAGTENTLFAAADAGIRRVVLVSTVAVYRTRLGTVMDEASALIDPSAAWHLDWNRITTRGGYARSKSVAERRAWEIARERGLELVVLRPGPIVGPGDAKLTARLHRWAQSGVSLVPTVRIPLVGVHEVAAATAAAITADATGRAYNLAGEPAALDRVVRGIRDATGGTAWIVPVPVPLSVRFDCSAAVRDLGFRPMDPIRWR